MAPSPCCAAGRRLARSRSSLHVGTGWTALSPSPAGSPEGSRRPLVVPPKTPSRFHDSASRWHPRALSKPRLRPAHSSPRRASPWVLDTATSPAPGLGTCAPLLLGSSLTPGPRCLCLVTRPPSQSGPPCPLGVTHMSPPPQPLSPQGLLAPWSHSPPSGAAPRPRGSPCPWLVLGADAATAVPGASSCSERPSVVQRPRYCEFVTQTLARACVRGQASRLHLDTNMA